MSLANPGRVLFRYRLDPVDKDWHNAGTRRQAFYTNLRSGRYRFYVTACNNDGVGNIKGASLYFRIEPAWYQTIWSKVMLVLSGIAFLLVLYLFDRRRYVTLLRVRFDERREVRTRLARELHDTLLQTIQASKMVADCAQTNLDDPAQTRTALERLSVWLDRATVEGRAALDSLRNSVTDTEDLASALRQAAESCVSNDMQVTFSVNGPTRSMHPVASHEIFRIGTEAIRNACTHSGGQSLTIELEFGRDLTLSVRDSGRGFNSTLLNSGKPGHFGIMCMRERASNLGGRLLLKTAEGQGTCLTLIVPGGVIFRTAEHTLFNIVGLRCFRKGPDVLKGALDSTS